MIAATRSLEWVLFEDQQKTIGRLKITVLFVENSEETVNSGIVVPPVGGGSMPLAAVQTVLRGISAIIARTILQINFILLHVIE